MKFIDFFAGIGGFRRGMELAGHECVGFCEWDKFATASYTSMHLLTEQQREELKKLDLKKRQKEILNEKYRNGEWYADDIRGVHAGDIPRADCWCFGAPCQDFSVAGHRAGLEGDRSSLVREVFRILWEIPEEDRPEWLIYENVKGMFSSNRGFDYLAILGEMDEAGYDAEWFLFNSKYHGVPQNRERVYTVGHFRARGPRSVFPIKGTDGEDSVQINIVGHRDGYRRNTQVFGTDGITESLDTAAGGGRGHHTAIPVDCFDTWDHGIGKLKSKTEETPTLRARDYKDPYRVGIPVQFGVDKSTESGEIEVANTLTAREDRGVSVQRQTGTAVAMPVLTPERAEKRQNGRRFKESEEDMFTLTAQDRHGVAIKVREAVQKGYTEAFVGDSINLSVPGSKTRRGRVGGQCAQTLDTGCNQGVIQILESIPDGVYVTIEDGTSVYAVWYEKYQCYIAIRKLTPRECFRLQGWSDDYFDRARFVNSDSQLYRQAGNGVTVNVVQIIGEKLRELENL